MNLDWQETGSAARHLASGASLFDLRSVLFLSAASADGAADTVRDAALDLGAQSDRPVLLLDLAIPGNRQYRAFAAAGLLAARAAVPSPGPADHAILHFEHVRGTRLFVSRVTPDPSCFAEITWALDSSAAIPRLRDLFSAIVIAAPELACSEGGLRMAPCVDGVVLVLRTGLTTVSEAAGLRDRVLGAGGRLMGAVMTHAPTPRPLFGATH